MNKQLFRVALVLVAVTAIGIFGCCPPTEPDDQTVTTPVFSPVPGTYADPLSVSISSATTGATIVYTTDGSDPVANSTVYASPIQIAVSTTFKAKALKQGLTDSAIASATYTIIDAPDQMVYVPGGTFIMGNTLGGGVANELPTHSVTLNPFYIGQYEVTQAEYEAIMASNPAHDHGLGDDHPVYYVTWYNALKYCNLRSLAEGLTPCYTISGYTDPNDWGEVPNYNNDTWNAAICNWDADGYRLPTEAEWEYAARGATNDPDRLYAGSDDINAVAWYSVNSGSATHPMGAKAPNGIGAYDMSGNVWEWCWDWFSDSWYSISPGNNPTGPDSGSMRLLRGGGWESGPGICRITYRRSYYPYGSQNGFAGFRVCRTIQ